MDLLEYRSEGYRETCITAIEPQRKVKISVVLDNDFQWCRADRLLIIVAYNNHGHTAARNRNGVSQARWIKRDSICIGEEFAFDTLDLYAGYTDKHGPGDILAPHPPRES
jgi:hypothetical protein